ncbi:MAG: right-handed parallel beta-helix repeat-containing protein [Chitinophagaceae bacterium]|nr:right-handed parallel beta-helix repeat-containing protein [Chitinophagaceae bacterium]
MKSIAAYLLRGRNLILVALLAVFSFPGFATDLYVSASAGNDANSGLLGVPKQTIQNAVASALDGDVIHVANGTYTLAATLYLNRELTIIGESEAGVIINAIAATGYGISPTKSNSSLSYLTILPNPTNGYPIHASSGNGTVISNISLSHITIQNSYRTAFDIHGVTNVTLSYLTATGTKRGNGISVTGCYHVTAGYLTTSGNLWGSFAVYSSQYVHRGSDNINIDATTSSFTDIKRLVYNQNEYGYTNTNITVNGYLYAIQNAVAMEYTDYVPNQAIALLASALFSDPSLTSFKQTVLNQYEVYPGFKIQAAVNSSKNGDKILVSPGTYTENIIVNKEVAIRGTSQAETRIIPAISNPDCGGSASSLCGGSSNVMLVQANHVTIADLTIDGDNPALSSGIVRGGADIDARNGIITNHTLGIPFNSLTVNHVTVRNIYWRGIYASSAGSFTIAENTVENVRGNPGYSIAIFNWQGSGYFTNNKVDSANDGIVSNWSTGTVYSGNTVTNSGSGIHTDNNGGAGGNADIIQNNLVKNSTAGGWGIWVFAPYLPVLVKDNTISNVDVGLSADAEWSPEIITFSGNTVDGQNKAGSYGVYFTTSTFWWGSTNLLVNFTNNTVVNNDYGIYLESEAGYNLSLAANNNSITSKYYNVSQATGAYGAGTFNVDMNCNWWGSAVGATINASIDGADVLHSSWLSNGTDIDAVAPGFQPATNICASPLSNVVVSAVTNADCYGASNGFAVITYQNGLPALSYTLNGGQSVAIAGSPFTISGLAAGAYNATLTDAGGYTATVNFTITQPAAITASVSAAGADAFCNTVTLTAAPAALGDTYSWLLVGGSFTAATKEISLGQTNADGTYQVRVTTNGCASQPGSFVFNKQYLISSYTLLAFDEIELGEKNTVAGGSVGVVSVKGKAAFHKNSSVAATGSFVKAKNIKREGSNIQITNPIYEAAGGITLPALQINNSNTKNLPNKEVAQNSNSTVNGNYKNLTLKKGSNTIITGNIFGTIRVEQGASARFTSTTINIDQLHVVQGPANGYSYIRFAPNTGVLVSGSVNIGSQVYVNPDNFKVTFYLADKKSDDEKFIVRGGGTKFTANIYIAKGKLKVTGGYGNDGEDKKGHDDDHNAGNGNSSVEMTGLFIAEKIASNGKNVTWNSFSCDALPVAVNNSSFVNRLVTEEKQNTTGEEALKVTVLPNPSTTYFTLKFESRYQAPVELRVIDSRGRLVDAKSKIASNSTIQIGHNYSSGTYFAEMIQGTRRKVVQLIKGKD